MPRRQPESESARKKHGRRQLSEEQRRQLSERAKRQHATGVLNAQKNGRKGGLAKGANATIAAAISDAAIRDKKAIILALQTGVREGTPAQRVKASETWVRLADLESQRQQRQTDSEQKANAQFQRDAAIAELAQTLARGPLGELLRQRLTPAEVIDGSAVEIASGN